MPTSHKLAQYQRLTADCRDCRRCGDQVRTPRGCERPSTWAMWLGNLDARVVIVGQDPAGADKVDPSDPASYPPGESVGTNLTLMTLLAAANLDPKEVYLTNAILCIKLGPMNKKPLGSWVTNCRPLLRRTLDLVAPVAAIGLGAIAWKSLCRAYGARPCSLTTAISQRPVRPAQGPWLVPMFHPGPLGQASRGLPLQMEDWRIFGNWLRTQGEQTRVGATSRSASQS